ncbi:MAG: hypothetical protein U5K36_16900 [Roseovarius sp.]|nr:hypothetical protein [Roseovarius sp.]
MNDDKKNTAYPKTKNFSTVSDQNGLSHKALALQARHRIAASYLGISLRWQEAKSCGFCFPPNFDSSRLIFQYFAPL